MYAYRISLIHRIEKEIQIKSSIPREGCTWLRRLWTNSTPLPHIVLRRVPIFLFREESIRQKVYKKAL